MPITFTFSELVVGFLAVCAGIVTIAKAIDWIGRAIQRTKKPNRDQNERIERLEQRVNEHDAFFKADKVRLDDIDEGNRVTQRAILALLSHGIDGNDVDGLKKAKDELTAYLTR